MQTFGVRFSLYAYFFNRELMSFTSCDTFDDPYEARGPV